MRPTTLPGPRGAFLVGSKAELRRDVLGFFARCARDYPDICGFDVLGVRCCLITHPALIEKVLVHEAHRMVKAWDLRQLRFALGHGLLTSDGEVWRRERRLVEPAFHSHRIREYAGIMVARGEEAASGWEDGEELDLHEEMMRLTLRIVAEALFGLEITSSMGVVSRALSEVMSQFEGTWRGWIPTPFHLPTPGNLRSRRAVRRLDRVIRDAIARRRAEGAGGTDLLSFLLNAKDDDGRPPSDRRIRDELHTLLSAGHETTAIALSWTLYLLALHPGVEEKVAAELDAVLKGSPPRHEDIPSLVYTRQTVEESMRLYPPAWALSREPVEDVEIGGHVLPRRTQIFMAQYLTHRDPRFYDDPETFAPERWSRETANERPKYAYFPFGGGPRHCIGSKFAMVEATLLLASICRRWRFELVPDHPIELQPAVTLRPRYGIRAVARRR